MGEVAPGDVLADRYEIRAVKRGGMGLVLLGYDRQFEEPVALKTFQDRFLRDQRSQERFRREAEAWIKLDRHPNIVYAHYFTHLEGKPYLALEMVADGPRGNGLRRRLVAGPLAIEEALAFGVQICRGLSHASAKLPSFVHRDLKPENLLITPDELIKVTDFGLVRTVVEQDGELEHGELESGELVTLKVGLTRYGVLVGTPQYMAPEQFGSAPDLDERADLYAFGVVLYEMLTGRPPFSGKTTRELAQAHLLQQPPRPRARRPELPDALERLVLRCLEKDRESRYPNFAELERQLGRLAAEHGWALPAAVDSVPLQVWEQTNKGSSLVALGHPREGLRCFEAALAGLPNYAPAFNNRGVALRQLGAHYDAVVSFHRALDLNGRYVDAWYNLGVTLGELGSSNRERDCYAKVLELDPRHFESWLNRGISLLEKAVHSGRRMALNGAREALDRALELRGGHAQAHYHRGLVHWLLGNAEPALLDLEIASFADPPWEPAPKVLSLCRAAPAGAGTGAPISLPPPPPLAELLQHGQALEVLGQPFEALALYDEILELHGSAPSLQRYRGDALLALGRIDAAVEAYQAAVGDDPDDWQAVLGWGRALLGRGSLKEALDRFLATTEARPSLTQGWRELARTLEALGRHREALTALERAEFGARQDPEFWGLRARVAMAAGQPLLAARFHARELRLDRSRAASHCARGRALLELRELRRALDAANMALRLEPELPDGWLLLGEVCLARGQPELALTCQRRAARLAPQAPEPTLLQARALRQLGRARSAAHCYQVYLQRRPDDTRIEAELADHLKGAAAR